jgi:long-chain acyl-CoA synthetase
MVLGAIGDIERFDLNLSFLPLAHVLERVGGHFVPLYLGRTVAYARSLETIAEDLLTVRPRYAIVVPRVLEKVYARIFARVQDEPAIRRAIFMWAVRTGSECSEQIERKRAIGPLLALKRAIAKKLVFSKIHKGVGGRLEVFVCGGAPLSATIARFFHSVGIMVCEGWGLTETSAPATVNAPGDFRFGSVGKPMPGVELRFAADGELLVRGENVFGGYFKDEKATREVFDENGFFRTGDIGRVDEDGFYYITDRKKELIITAAGKNIAPQKIETMLKERAIISNALVHGDRRNYLVAILTLDRGVLRQTHPGLSARPVDDPEVRAVVGAEISIVNEELARFEQIKDFRIVEEDFTVERGELTVTMKLKRRVIEKTYMALLDEMYPAEIVIPLA